MIILTSTFFKIRKIFFLLDPDTFLYFYGDEIVLLRLFKTAALASRRIGRRIACEVIHEKVSDCAVYFVGRFCSFR